MNRGGIPKWNRWLPDECDEERGAATRTLAEPRAHGGAGRYTDERGRA